MYRFVKKWNHLRDISIFNFILLIVLVDQTITVNAQSAKDSADAALYFKSLNHDSLLYNLSLWSPSRDLDYRIGDKAVQRVAGCLSSNFTNCKLPLGACRTAKIYTFCDPGDAPVAVCDPFGNYISRRGVYGNDPRNQYYIYLPKEYDYNSPIVVLVHGGGWFSGPNPEQTSGYPFKFAPDGVDSSYVKDLLQNGYVVVSVLYRLSKLGNTQAEWTANTVGWQEQINDLDAANAYTHPFPYLSEYCS